MPAIQAVCLHNNDAGGSDRLGSERALLARRTPHIIERPGCPTVKPVNLAGKGLVHEESTMRLQKRPPDPIHISGTAKGEEYALEHGKEPGRGGRQYRSARDSTGINASLRRPIHPAMPDIPPA